MAVKIKLKRLGKMREPHYRIIVADSRTKRDGRAIEEIGQYHPKHDPSIITVDADRVAYWLGVGAQPTEPVAAILKVTGDWQKFKGEPAPEPMRVAPPKPDKKAAFEAAAKESAAESDTGATTPKAKARKPEKKAEPKTEQKPEKKAEPKTEQKPEKKAEPKTEQKPEKKAEEPQAPAAEGGSDGAASASDKPTEA